MKKLFYLLFFVFIVSSCDDNLESISENSQEATAPGSDLSLVAKTNVQKPAKLEAYINSQLNSLTLTDAEKEKATSSINASEFIDLNSQARYYNNTANQYYAEGNYELALFYYLNSLQLKIITNNIKGLAISYRNIALAYQAKGDYRNASLNYWQSLYSWESLGKESRRAQLYNDLGVVYDLARDFVLLSSFSAENSLSLSYYEQSIAISTALNDVEGIEQTQHNINLLLKDKEEQNITATDRPELSRDQDDVEDEL